MKVAVTGASGFIGRHVLAALAHLPDIEVIASARSVNPPAYLPKGFTYIPFDIADRSMNAYDALGAPDILMHLAWGGLPNYRSSHHFEEELPRQYAFLKSMVENGLGSLLITGTCYEYGMSYGPLTEDRTGEPTNAYAFAKIALLNQLLLLKSQQTFGLSWARLFYSYGEGQAPSSLLPLIEAAVARGDARFAMSGGEQLRDYLPAPVVAEYLTRLALQNTDPGIVNICSGEPMSIRRLVETQRASRGWNIEFDYGHYPYPDYEPMAFWGDPSKLEKLLKNCQLADG